MSAIFSFGTDPTLKNELFSGKTTLK